MPIPDFDRVIYQKPALTNVVCQLHFPPILRIGAEDPVAFQDGIRQEYPNFEERPSDFLNELPPELRKVLPATILGKTGEKIYDFLSKDRKWQVSLARNFIALSTEDYNRWEEFKAHLEPALNQLHEQYRPSFYSRIGLRYRDVITRSKLGLEGVPWWELLQPHIAGELTDEHVRNEVKEAKRLVLIDLGENVGQVRLRHDLDKLTESDEDCYVIDADYFTERNTEPSNAIETLNRLNGFAGRLFRWCITERVYQSMDPRPVD
jgi:uncharacterized protein (TIGR04255 family)